MAVAPARHSAGILLYRRTGPELEVLLIHPGGPYWLRRDQGAWQIPKGQVEADEAPEAAALREVEEELGVQVQSPLQPLGEVRQAGGKRVTAYGAEQDLDAEAIVSNLFEMEWPPRSGRLERFPEVSAARWLTLEQARIAMLPSQLPLLDRLAELAGRS